MAPALFVLVLLAVSGRLLFSAASVDLASIGMMPPSVLHTRAPDTEQILQQLEYAAHAGGDRARVIYGLFKAHLLHGDYERSGEALSSYLSMTSDSDVPMLWLAKQAETLVDAGRDEDALQITAMIDRLALRRKQADHRSLWESEANQLVGRAWRLDLAGDHQSAIALVKLSIALAPWSPEGFYNLGDFYLYQQRWSEALDSYERGLTEDPLSCRGLIGVGKVYLYQDQKEFADNLLSSGEQLLAQGEDTWGHYMIGRAFHWQGKEELAIEHYQAIVDLPHDGDVDAEPIWGANIDLGSIYEERGDADAAIAYYRAAVRASTQYGRGAEALALIAHVYRSQGKHEEAIKELEQALTLLADSSSAQELKLSLLRQLGDSCWVVGRSECSDSAYEKVLSVDPQDTLAKSRISR